MATVSLGTTSFSGVTLSPSSTSSTTQTTTTTKTPEEQFKELQQQFIKGDISGKEFATKAKALGYNVTANTNTIQLPKVADLQAQITELKRLRTIAVNAKNTAVVEMYDKQIEMYTQILNTVNTRATTTTKQTQIAKILQVDSKPISPSIILTAQKTNIDAMIEFAGSAKCTFTGKSVGKRYLTQLSNEYQKVLDKIQTSNLSNAEIKALLDDLETKSASTFKSTAVKSVEKEFTSKYASDPMMAPRWWDRFQNNLDWLQGGGNAEDLYYLYWKNEDMAFVHVTTALLGAIVGWEF